VLAHVINNRYGSSHYNAATWRKVVVVEQIVSWGFNVLHSDVDVVGVRLVQEESVRLV
jgi:hypothetical protein